MKSIKDYIYINEKEIELIDDQWIQDEKPVKTLDGRQVIVLDVDLSEVPNVIKGQVKMGTKMFDYEWNDDGTCVKALDKFGNPKKPDKSDMLIKDI